MGSQNRTRRIFRFWSWVAFAYAVVVIATTGEGLLSLLARIEHDFPTTYAWVDLFVTFVPFLLLVGLGLRTPAEQVRDRIAKLKQQFRAN